MTNLVQRHRFPVHLIPRVPFRHFCHQSVVVEVGVALFGFRVALHSVGDPRGIVGYLCQVVGTDSGSMVSYSQYYC